MITISRALAVAGIAIDPQRVIHGDCLEVLCTFPDNHVDSVITDPPYGLGSKEPAVEEIIAYLNGADLDTGGDFMGKKWKIPSVAVWREVYRVLKPGGLVLSFGGTRTFDLISLGLRAAGFENRDTISNEGVELDPVLRWTYGQGFPHSLNIGREIDMERCVLSGRHYDKTFPKGDKVRDGDHLCPSHPDGDPHRGEGTALKPAWEPILCFRKPLGDSVAKTVLRHGTGAMNIDGCRIGFASKEDEEESKKKNQHAKFGNGPITNQVYGEYTADRTDYDPKARWPANVVLSDAAAEVMDAQSGIRKSGTAVRRNGGGGRPGGDGRTRGEYAGGKAKDVGYGDVGGASRVFFRYCAKASRSEREAGCGSLPARSGAMAVEREEGSAGTRSPRAGAGRTAKEVRNHHVSVKPLELMRWLVRLVTPKGGRVLDMFCGSGTTLCAAALEGFSAIGIDDTVDYVEIARARVAYWRKSLDAEPPNDLPLRGMNPLLERFLRDDPAVDDEAEDAATPALVQEDEPQAGGPGLDEAVQAYPEGVVEAARQLGTSPGELVAGLAKQTSIFLPSTIGERIPVAMCVEGSEYMVDCEDGHPPCRMRLREISRGKYKFQDAVGARVDLEAGDFVWRTPPGFPPMLVKDDEEGEGAVHAVVASPCGAPGCGVGCRPGMIFNGHGYVECGACRGKGSLGSAAAPASPSSVPAAAAVQPSSAPVRASNCLGSGRPVKVAPKVACPVCGEVRSVPKADRELAEISFPGHRAKAGASVLDPAAANAGGTPVPDVQVAVSPEAVDAVLRESNGLAGSVLLASSDVDILSALLGDRARAIPRAALSEEAVGLLRRLRLVD